MYTNMMKTADADPQDAGVCEHTLRAQRACRRQAEGVPPTRSPSPAREGIDADGNKWTASARPEAMEQWPKSGLFRFRTNARPSNPYVPFSRPNSQQPAREREEAIAAVATRRLPNETNDARLRDNFRGSLPDFASIDLAREAGNSGQPDFAAKTPNCMKLKH